ncbi:hypothetical protein GR210_12690 [Rhizobium leguminosarum]|uniref:Uncharacterized protein n=7 Tax=Rhizobium TaxID=379 RepID=A0A4R0AMP6_RHILV|nr:hypothetical protein CHR56_36665 [Rhizobium leguminosarum bv. viciae]NEH49638.1 hypothetical protein [Rhizobium leguminosarum]NEJ15704.1 hypothetical protein [Rhizobium ruizarguesonis]NKM58173.1 hypothetical protein [Rhizobium anhuiense]PUB65338.1 hypothetical protein DB728_07525 [Rhizobium leguminosarum bv. viciae USDA 2370]TCA60993.1 hypothetical protein E0J16_04995 [Rhizobium pisi]
MPWSRDSLKDERFPQNAGAFRLPHSPPLAVACAILDPDPPPRRRASSFSNIKEMTMIEQQIEELRAELNACIEPAERREIEAELEIAQAELIMMLGEQDGSIDAEPPF